MHLSPPIKNPCQQKQKIDLRFQELDRNSTGESINSNSTYVEALETSEISHDDLYKKVIFCLMKLFGIQARKIKTDKKSSSIFLQVCLSITHDLSE